jgi:hypothetical protein
VQRTGNIAVRGTAPTRSGLFLQRLRGSAVFNAFDLMITQIEPYKSMKNIRYLLLVAVLLIFGACEQEEKLPTLTASQREQIDTLYLQRVNVLRPQLDSACMANFAASVQQAADSLVKVRREEAARLRERILQNND